MQGALVEGTIVIIDLDRFEEVTERLGLDRYRPNRYTGLLSGLVESLASRWSAVVVYGLDWRRGTEEAVLEIPLVEPREVKGDLVKLARRLCEEGIPATIVAVKGLVGAARPIGRREAYTGSPDRARARRLLESLKRRGGGAVLVEDAIVWRCRGSV
ncbi:MAG: hypothetical protein F7B20_07625 [Aeropyrum sp.]|nr:hypothetical protein [Aeropyrum sp.]